MVWLFLCKFLEDFCRYGYRRLFYRMIRLYSVCLELDRM